MTSQRIPTTGRPAAWTVLVDAAATGAATRADLLCCAVRAATQLVDGVVACSVTEMVGAGYRTASSSSGAALALDQVQYYAGTGPCVLAARDGVTGAFDSESEACRTRFRPLLTAALARGVHSALSVPLTGTPRLAALNLYAAAADSLASDSARRSAAGLGRCVSAVLSAGGGDSAGTSVVTRQQLEDAMADLTLVSRAVNHIVAGEGISADAALAELATRSRQQGRSMAEVAAAVSGPAQTASAG